MTPRPNDGLTVQLAEYSGTCPECGRWIRAGRSKIAPFPVPLPLRLNLMWHTGRERRSRVTPDGVPIGPMDARAWGHEKRVRRYLRRHTGQDHGKIADARRKALEDYEQVATQGDRDTASRSGGRS
jgi:hypothetical protein